MSIRCAGTDPGGGPCPWEAVIGEALCGFHLEAQRSARWREETAEARQQADQEREEWIRRRQEAAELRRKVAEQTREFEEWYAANLPRLEAEDRERKAKLKQERIDAWHARRRAENEERRARAAEAREAAQEAAQDPSTRQDCRDCGRSLPLDAFHRDRLAPLGRKTRCRDCQRAYDRERRSKP